MNFNESKSLDDKYFKAIYKDLLEDVKDILDIAFIDFIDKDYDISILKINTREGSFFTRYKIEMGYIFSPGRKLKGDSIIKHNTIENYSSIMSRISEDLLNMNNSYTHIKDEYSDVSIFGHDLPKNSFDTTVFMEMDNGSLFFRFILDIK